MTSEAPFDHITDEQIQKAVGILLKTFLDNKIGKPLSGIAMLFLIKQLENDGYVFQLVPMMEPSNDIH